MLIGRTLRTTAFVAIAALNACDSPSNVGDQDESLIASFTLTDLGADTLPAMLTFGLYVTGGTLKLWRTGLFLETMTRNTAGGIGGTGNARGGLVTDAVSGFWTQRSDGSFELRYSDRRPTLFDTATFDGTRLTKHCAAFVWCGPQLLMTFKR